MYLLTYAGCALLALLIARKHDERLPEAIALSVTIHILALYVLAFFRMMQFIGGLSGLIALAAYKEWAGFRRKDITEYIKKCLKPGTGFALAMAVVLMLLQIKKGINWWDDLNYWAPSAKQMFYLNGFAPMNANVAPEFGDYPPGMTLFQWWILKLNPLDFKAALYMGAFYLLMVVYFLPLLDNPYAENRMTAFISAAAVIVIPGAVDSFYFKGCPADIIQGEVYGYLLWTMYRYKPGKWETKKLFLLSCVLLLLKSSSLLYIAFLLLWGKMLQKSRFSDWGRPVLLAVPAVSVTWYAFCFLTNRTNYQHDNIAGILLGGYDWKGKLAKYGRIFVQAVFSQPLHRNLSLGLDFTIVAYAVFVLSAFYCCYRKALIGREELRAHVRYQCFTGVILYGLLLLAHMTIFAGESQYDHAENMVYSLSKYGAPFTIGALYLLIGLLCSRDQNPVAGKKLYWVIIVIILLSGDVPRLLDSMVGIHIRGNYVKQYILMDAESKELVDYVQQSRRLLSGNRVLYLKNSKERANNLIPAIKYNASPISVIVQYTEPDIIVEETVFEKAKDVAADYVYLDGELSERLQKQTNTLHWDGKLLKIPEEL